MQPQRGEIPFGAQDELVGVRGLQAAPSDRMELRLFREVRRKRIAADREQIPLGMRGSVLCVGDPEL